MTKRVFDRYNGLTEYVHFDPMKPNDLIIETVQDDFESILEDAKAARDAPVGRELRLVAKFPLIFYHQAHAEGWLHDKAKWRKLLNDPDLKRFRVWGGRIGPHGQH